MWDLLDLNYKMGSQRQWTVFELLDLLFAVNMQLYVCRKRIGIIQGSFGHFIQLTGFLAISRAQFEIKLHAHAPVHTNWLKNQICVIQCMLRSHGRNGNEFFGVLLAFFYRLTGFSRHFMCIIQIRTTSTCSNAPKLVEKSHVCPWVNF